MRAHRQRRRVRSQQIDAANNALVRQVVVDHVGTSAKSIAHRGIGEEQRPSKSVEPPHTLLVNVVTGQRIESRFPIFSRAPVGKVIKDECELVVHRRQRCPFDGCRITDDEKPLTGEFVSQLSK